MSRLPASSKPRADAPAGEPLPASPMSTSTTAPLPAAEAPAAPAEMGIGSAALLGLIGAAAGVGFSIARSKVTALVLGPDGFGKAAQILQIVAVANLPATMVTGPALVSSVAEATRRGDR